MDTRGDVLDTTTSLCPDCLEQVPGQYERADDGVYLTRECADHGTTSRQVWGSFDHWEWAGEFGPDPEYEGEGDLTVAGDHACLAVIEVTEDCNLSCSYCFASSGPGGPQRSAGEVRDLLETVREHGPRPIQFSGGEPTVRDDLPELVAEAVDMGFSHVEVNTNGLRLAQEEGYARRLAEAGVTAVYLQFDGLSRETYVEIREADILEFKHGAIEACREAGVPVILVPTVVPGVNDDEMGDVVRFALENRDVVRSVNFQPVAHFGRYADSDGRFPLDEAARRLAEQVDAVEPLDLLPAPCCSSYCQIGTALLPRDGDGEADDVVPLTRYVEDELWDAASGMIEEGDYMELLAGTAAGQEFACTAAGCCGGDIADSAGEIFDSAVPVSITGFMDADAGDVDRLSNCCLSVPTPDGELAPFCGFNMTTEDGEYALRNRHGWGGRDVVDPEEHGDVEPGETGGDTDSATTDHEFAPDGGDDR